MISICFPTRGRIENVKRLVQSLVDTTEILPEVIVYVDDDDTDTLAVQVTSASVSYVVGPRKTLSACYNDCAAKACGDILMFAGDDLLFRTPGWDVQVEQAFAASNDKLIFVHGDDGHWKAELGTHGFLHRKWCAATGYFIPPYFSCDMTDMWITDVANALGRKVYLPILIEHMHPAFGKAEWDTTHNERKARGERDNVQQLYYNLGHKRLEDIEKLRKVMA